jgi:hypothetical protein
MYIIDYRLENTKKLNILPSFLLLVYERPSRLEREAGDAKSADDYMNSAVQTCGNTRWKDCSFEKINRISRKIEENGLVSPKSTKTVDGTSKH